MIPKIIHYCWFGNNPLPESVKKCIRSWRRYCPDYKIIRWNESNFNVHGLKYTDQAYKRKKYAFVSDYARLYVVKKYGGIYLDTDVELIRGLDDLLNYDAFFGLEGIGRVNTGLGFGAKKEMNIIKRISDLYTGRLFYDGMREDKSTCVDLSAPIFHNLGLKNKNITQFFDNGKIAVLATDYLCPQSMESGKIKISLRTYSIHHYDASWKGHPILSRYTLRIKIKVHRIVDKILGDGTYEKLKEKLLCKK